MPNKRGLVERKGSYKTDRESRIYCIRTKANAVKIGFSDEPIGRLKVLKSGNDEIKLLSDFPVSNALACEKILHEHFGHLNISHEIFEDKPEIHEMFAKIVKLGQTITPQMLAEIIKGNAMEAITKDKRDFAYETVRKAASIYQNKELFLKMLSTAWDFNSELEKLDKVVEVEKPTPVATPKKKKTKSSYVQLKKNAVVEIIKSEFLGSEVSQEAISSHLKASQRKETVSVMAFDAAISVLTNDSANYKVVGENGKFTVSSRLNGHASAAQMSN